MNVSNEEIEKLKVGDTLRFTANGLEDTNEILGFYNGDVLMSLSGKTHGWEISTTELASGIIVPKDCIGKHAWYIKKEDILEIVKIKSLPIITEHTTPLALYSKLRGARVVLDDLKSLVGDMELEDKAQWEKVLANLEEAWKEPHGDSLEHILSVTEEVKKRIYPEYMH